MAGSAYFPDVAIRNPDFAGTPHHIALVRITHWINTLSFFGLLVSGVAILLAHPRFYWGETGNVGTPSLFDLPLPFVLTGQTGWGRSLHFLSAWVCVLNGLLYVISGIVAKHFRVVRHVREDHGYNVVQRLTYIAVVAILFPLMIWTGLAMSPAITSVFPVLVTSFGGQQSARTIHFFVADFLVLFLFVHVTMISLAGFTSHVRAMITGGKDRA
jgi:thiosulfate reductase cytochrome b subunit